MAKQTFTTGSVLTAAQMTSLQQTAMLGGAASAKTANYTLAAADAGTVITMSNAGATTITVNTGLFSAGDTVTILNVGAGTCTITAGTATVAKPTNATLALVTSAGGVLYFTATGASTFMPFDVGSASSGGMTLLDSGSLSGASVTSASLSGSYNNLYVQLENVLPVDDGTSLRMRYNSDTNTRYQFGTDNFSSAISFANTSIYLTTSMDNVTQNGIVACTIYNYAGNTFKLCEYSGFSNDATDATKYTVRRQYGYYNQTTAISTINFTMASGNFTSGTYKIYGIK